jgi:hypothetical protein
MSEPDEMANWVTTTTPDIGSFTSSATGYTTSWMPHAPTSEQLKAWMGAIIQRLELLQQRIRELEAKQNGR